MVFLRVQHVVGHQWPWLCQRNDRTTASVTDRAGGDGEEKAQEGEAQGTKDEEDAQVEQLELQIGTEVYQVRLAQTEAAQAFAAKLPLTLSMKELNGNEKYSYLDEALPTEAERVGQIESGDLMLYGEDCVVLFYDSFSTNYSYTPLGRVEDATGLKEAVGEGAVTMTFQEKG